MHRSIFVSSTFRDMHLERDTIHTRIIPFLDKKASQYGDSVSACDLRWGINTSDLEDTESSRKVLNVCLGEIDRCRPYMVVLLGYRYGWIPDQQLIRQTVSDKDSFTLDEDDISVTALEIEYGALSHLEDIDHTLFYFREIDGPYGEVYGAEDEYHRAKLNALKAKIQATPGAHVRTYHVDLQSPEESMLTFGRMLVSDLYGLLLEEWQQDQALDKYALDQKKQWEYLREKGSQFLARNELLHQCKSVVQQAGEDLLVYGQTGSGKSTLMSRLAQEMAAEGTDVVPIFCGYTNMSTDGLDLVQYIVYETERRLGTEHFVDKPGVNLLDQGAWLTCLQNTLDRYAEQKQQTLMFLIDGIDQLTQDAIAENYAYVPQTHGCCIRFVLSTVTSPRMPLEKHQLVGDLTEHERLEVIRGILAGRHRELSDAVIRKMLQLPNARLPLYLSLIVQRMVMMDHNDFMKIAKLGDGMDAITRYQLSLIDECPESLNDMSVYVMGNASSQIGGEPVKLMGYYLAVSRHGLRFTDLEQLVGSLRQLNGERMQLHLADAAGFLQYFGHFFFTRSDGRIDFTHKCFRQGLLESLGDQAPALHSMVAKWLHHLPKEDEVRTQELGWHLIQADEVGMLSAVLATEGNSKALSAAIMKDMAEQAMADDGKWLIDGMKYLADDPTIMFFTGYVCNNMVFLLPDNRKGLDLRKQLVLTALDIKEELLNKQTSHPLYWDVSAHYERLSAIEGAYGTAEHAMQALDYARKCLDVRRNLLKYLEQVKADHKEIDMIMAGSETSGIRITQKISQQQAESVWAGLHQEYRHGICVADELVAGSLADQFPDTAEEALTHLEESLAIRREFHRQNAQGTYIAVSGDETYELIYLLMKIAEVYEVLGNDAALETAEQYLRETISLSEEAVVNEASEDRCIQLSQARCKLATFISVHQPQCLEKAFTLVDQARQLMEKIYLRTRDAKAQTELSLVYMLLGSMYDQKDDADSRELAHQYYEKMNDLSQGLLFKSSSVSSQRIAIIAELNEAVSAGSLSLAEMTERFSAALAIAKELFLDAPTEEKYDLITEVYNTLVLAIGQSDFSATTEGKRAVIEARCACLDWGFRLQNMPAAMIRQRIVEYNELSSEIQALALPDDAVWPDEWMTLLECMEITRDLLNTMPARRAYDLSKKSLLLARKMFEEDDSLSNEDALAVSLSKFSEVCMQIDLKEFGEVSAELKRRASTLHQKTRDPKYIMMLILSQMGSKLAEGDVSGALGVFGLSSDKGNGSQSKDEPVTEQGMRDAARHISGKALQTEDSREEERENIEEQIRTLEQKIKSVGLSSPLRYRKMKQELAVLKKQLEDLQ